MKIKLCIYFIRCYIKLNNLISAIVTTWVTAPGDGGAALKVLISTLYSTTLAPTIQTNKTEIENNKFLQ